MKLSRTQVDFLSNTDMELLALGTHGVYPTQESRQEAGRRDKLLTLIVMNAEILPRISLSDTSYNHRNLIFFFFPISNQWSLCNQVRTAAAKTLPFPRPRWATVTARSKPRHRSMHLYASEIKFSHTRRANGAPRHTRLGVISRIRCQASIY